MAATVARPDPPGHGKYQDDIFRSVFPRPNFTTPTPEATPNIGSISSPGQPFGGFNAISSIDDNVVRYNRAWSSATRYLTLSSSLTAKAVPVINDTLNAFDFLLASTSTATELANWYANEIGSHFRYFVEPELQSWQEPVQVSAAAVVLQDTIALLQKAQSHYLNLIHAIAAQAQDASLQRHLKAFAAQIKRTLHSLVLQSLPQQRLQKTLASIMYQQMESSLQANSNEEYCLKSDQCRCKVSLQNLPLREMQDVGLGDLVGERAFAHAAHKFLLGPAIERRCFEVDWTGHTSVVPKLRAWVGHSLVPTMEETLGSLTGNKSLKFAASDIDQFVSMAVANLGRLRTDSVFDYIKSWPASTGAILDIWEYLNAGSQNEKAHVCQSFSKQVQRRLLHAGASTSEILSIYVNVIHAFKSLDSRGVLLEKVAVPIRKYLRLRDDTVNIIAASFLAEVEHDDHHANVDFDKVCPDITNEVENSTLQSTRDLKMLNWDDMDWTPDPIDAGPDYKSNKSEDIIAYILGLFEQEEFIKEITNVLAQHLLQATDSMYLKETRLVELFKSRLDPTKLQAAEVMLKDVRDSVSLNKRINPDASYESSGAAAPTPREIQAAIPEEGITLASLWRMFEGRMQRAQFAAVLKLVANRRNDLFFAKRTRLPPETPKPAAATKEQQTSFKAQIVSSFFWPQLRSNEFDMPRALDPVRERFEYRFESLGNQRKLHFKPALARVSIRLELEDRTIEEDDVAGWRASVIDAFGHTGSAPENRPEIKEYDALGLSIEDVMDHLKMEEELVLDALNFWASKDVLYERPDGAYAVLERLDMDTGAARQHVQQEETISAVKSEDAVLRESALMFETFIANMLRNQGQKQVDGMMGITSLLKMVLPTFTYGDDEVRWLLSEMEGRGEVMRNGEMWSVAQ